MSTNSLADIFIRQGDDRPYVRRVLFDVNGGALDLTSATVMFRMRHQMQPTIVVAAGAVVLDAANGIVEYRWAPTDSAIAGYYNGEFVVTFADTTTESHPNDHFLIVSVTPAL